MSSSTDARAWIEAQFPRLRGTARYEPVSPIDEDYNCIAFAAGDTRRWWWPRSSFPGGFYWPATAPQEETIDAFVAAFELLGYELCSDESLEPGYEKVVLYQDAGKPTHAARQQADGTWLSKLGQAYDISHDTPEAVGGNPGYGNVVAVMRRPVGDEEQGQTQSPPSPSS